MGVHPRSDFQLRMPWWWLRAVVVACHLLTGCLASAEETSSLNVRSLDVGEIESRMTRAALDVVDRHRRSADPFAGSRQYDLFVSIPSLPDLANFMHSYYPSTGVGNREEIIIESIHEQNILTDVDNVKFWRYIRHNSSDLVLAVQSTSIIQWKMKWLSDAGAYDLVRTSATHVYEAGQEGKIIDAMFFTRTVKNRQVLYIASLLENSGGVTLNVHEVSDHYAFSVMVMPLKNKKPYKLAYVESQFGGSLVLMYNSPERATHIKSELKGRDNSYRVIEVYAHLPVDLTTFTINGFGYIAVAYQDGCDIFRMDEFADNNDYLFDRIKMTGIIGLSSFRLGFKHFLTIATPHEQTLFAWHGGGFFPKQDFSTRNTSQIFSVYLPTCRDDVFLFFITRNEDVPVVLFVWSGQQQRFVKAIGNVMDLINPKFLPRPHSMIAFTASNTALILMVDVQGTSRMISLHSRLGAIPDPVVVKGHRITHIMSLLKERMKKQKDFMEYVGRVLDNAIQSMGHQIIRKNSILRNLKVFMDVFVNRLAHLGAVSWQGSHLTMRDLQWKLDDLKRNITIINQLLDGILNDLRDAVLKDESAAITARKVIRGIRVPELNAESLNLDKAAGFDVSSIQANLFRMDHVSPISGRKHFQGSVFVKTDVNVNKVNAISLSEVVTTNEPQILSGFFAFENTTWMSNIALSGTINGLNVTRDIVTLGGTHRVEGPKTFLGDVRVRGNASAPVVDDVDIAALLHRAVTGSKNQVVSSTKTLTHVLTTTNVTLNGTVSGIRISHLPAFIARTDMATTILGQKTFLDHVDIQSELIVNGTIDGLWLPAYAFLADREQTIMASKIFSNMAISHVSVGGTVDGILLDDVVTLTDNEFVEGIKLFLAGIHVHNNVTVGGTVDSVKISELGSNVLRKSELLIDGMAKFVGPVTVDGHLQIDGLTNEVDVSALAEDAIFRNFVGEVEVAAPKIFSSHIRVREIRTVGKINGFSFPEDLLLISGNQQVAGVKAFNSFVLFGSHLESNGLIDGVNFKELYNTRISLDHDGILPHGISFLEDVTILGNITITAGTIGGIRPEQAVLIHSEQHVAKKIFVGDVIAELFQIGGSVHVGRFINGFELAFISEKRVTLSTDQVTSANYVFGNVSSAEVTVQGFVNGMNLTEFVANTMSLSRSQVVLAPKAFTGVVQAFGDIRTDLGVNGRLLGEVNAEAFHLHGKSIVKADFTFLDSLQVDGRLDVMGRINDVNLTFLYHDVVRKRGAQSLHGSCIFASGFHVMGDIDAATVNDLVLPMQILTKGTDQNIEGFYKVQSGLTLSGNLFVKGLINGIDVSHLHGSVVRLDKDVTISGSLAFFNSSTVEGDIVVTQLTNNRNLSLVAQDIVYKAGDQRIEGWKTIAAPVESRSHIFTSFVNGIHLPNFLEDMVFFEDPQIVKATKTFVGQLQVASLLKVRGSLYGGVVNQIDLVQLANDAVYVDRPAIITGVKSWASASEIRGNVTISGRINGIKLPVDAVLLSRSPGGRSQVITGTKKLSRVHLANNLFVNGSVNGWHLPSLVDDTLLIHGDQTVTGSKTLRGVITFGDDVSARTVNDLDLQESVVFLQRNQTLSGVLHFLRGLTVSGNLVVQGFVNNVDIVKMAAEAVFLDANQTITAPHAFERVLVENVSIRGLIDSVDFSEFYQQAVKLRQDVDEGKARLGHLLNAHSHVTGYLEGVVRESYVSLDGLILHQILEDVYGTWIDLDVTLSTVTILNRYDNDTKVEAHDLLGRPDGLLGVGRNHYLDTVKKHYFRMDGDWYVVHQALPGAETVLFRNDKKLVSLGNRTLDVAIAEPSDGSTTVAIAVLLERGVVAIAELKYKDVYDSSLEFNSRAEVGTEATSIVAFQVKGEIFLLVGRKSVPASCHVVSSLLLLWKDKRDLNLVQEIPVGGVMDSLHFIGHDSKHYVVFADATPPHMTLEQHSLKVYRSCSDGNMPLTLVQKIPFLNPTFLDVFMPRTDVTDIFMVAANKSTIEVFRYDGEAGFSSAFSVAVGNVKSIKPYIWNDQIYFIVAQGEGCQGSRIFRAVTQGASLTPMTLAHWN